MPKGAVVPAPPESVEGGALEATPYTTAKKAGTKKAPKGKGK